MLVSFRQTYGDGRDELYEILSKDERLLEFYNLFDLNIVSFHNCSEKTIQNYKKLNRVKNVEYIEFNGITYGECISKLKKKLYDIGCTYFFFTQDDTFSHISDWLNFEELINYIKEQTENFLICFSYFKYSLDHDAISSISGKSFNLYKFTTADFKERCMWPMDDSPYICTIDLLNKIYDSRYCEFKNIWDAEFYLRDKFKKEIMPKYIIADMHPLFRNFNLIGRNTGSRETEIELLKKRKLIIEDLGVFMGANI